jgi:cell wall-associated NlpC family hydrolase
LEENELNKKWISTALAGALLFGSAPVLLPTSVHAALVGEIESSVSFRTGPSTDDSRIRYLQSGENVTILEQTNKYWYKIEDKNGKIGYTSTKPKYISVTDAAPTARAAQTGQIVASVSMRVGPSTSYARIRYAQAGETVTILSQPNSYWYEIKDKFGNVGFISSNTKYISATYTAPAPSVPTVTNQGVIVSSVSLREAASSSSTRIRYVKTGEPVSILNKPSSYWYEVKDKFGNVGFVSTNSKYINANYEAPKVELEDVPATVERIIQAGIDYLGTPYEYGSSRYDNSTFDCSDFVRTAFYEGSATALPSNSRTQGDFVKSLGRTTTDWTSLKRGDIVFFMSYIGSDPSEYSALDKSVQRITHNAIYLGNGQILHTYSKASGGVRIDTIGNNQWENRFLFGGGAL